MEDNRRKTRVSQGTRLQACTCLYSGSLTFRNGRRIIEKNSCQVAKGEIAGISLYFVGEVIEDMGGDLLQVYNYKIFELELVERITIRSCHVYPPFLGRGFWGIDRLSTYFSKLSYVVSRHFVKTLQNLGLSLVLLCSYPHRL